MNKRGFSLAEVLMALGVLTVGMLLMASVFPVGIHYAGLATEKAIAPNLADEAFANIHIWAVGDPDDEDDDIDLQAAGSFETSWLFDPDNSSDYEELFPVLRNNSIDLSQDDYKYFKYPSLDEDKEYDADHDSRKYFWSAIMRRLEGESGMEAAMPVQVTVFVCRKMSANLEYPGQSGTVEWPMPVPEEVSDGPEDNELRITDNRNYFYEGASIVFDETGHIYQVMERYKDDVDIVRLNRNLQDSDQGGGDVWVVPRPDQGGRNPCVGVYQKMMKF